MSSDQDQGLKIPIQATEEGEITATIVVTGATTFVCGKNLRPSDSLTPSDKQNKENSVFQWTMPTTETGQRKPEELV